MRLRRRQIGIDAVEVDAGPGIVGIDAGPAEQLAELTGIGDVVAVAIGREYIRIASEAAENPCTVPEPSWPPNMP